MSKYCIERKFCQKIFRKASEEKKNIDSTYVLTYRRCTQSFNQIGQQEGNKAENSQEPYKNQSFSENIWKLEKKQTREIEDQKMRGKFQPNSVTVG